MSRIASLYRYPVKSMLGEELPAVDVTERGLAGDRSFAVVDLQTGLVASAKQPRKWGALLQCRATFVDGTATVALPDGTTIRSDASAIDGALSEYVGRAVTLSSVPPGDPHLERWWPEVEGLAPPEVIDRVGTVTPMAAAAASTFFDYGPVHIVTTSSLRALRSARPGTDFAVARFRPNILIDAGDQGFVENDWVGRQLGLGPDLVLEILTVSPRCAVPSLAHGALPKDLEILRGVVAANRIPVRDGHFACVGVYGRVLVPGSVAVGMAVGWSGRSVPHEVSVTDT